MSRGSHSVKPLYIEGQARILVDGPALRVRVAGQADRLFPLRQVSRVVSGCSAVWDTRSLLACAERGIVVTFVTRKGDVRARLLGGGDRRLRLAQRLSDLLDRPDWRDVYGIWVMALEHRFAARLACGLGIELRPNMGFDQLARKTDQMLLRHLDKDDHRMLKTVIRSLLTARISDELAQWGVDGCSEVFQHAGFYLVDDLVRIASWPVMADVATWIVVRSITDGGVSLTRAEIVHFFEDRAVRTTAEIGELMQRLYHWVTEGTA